MMMQRQDPVYSCFFGPYILTTRIIPGKQQDNIKEEKERENELFEMIDDYIEQA
ncbi:MAG: hypothetical protein KHY46_13790 [Clostridiales bacterium]|nr:hypothetical protein [Clostridiales bacterium]